MPSTLVNLLREGTLEQVKAHIEEDPLSVKEKDKETGRIALHYAVEDPDDLAVVVELAKKINVLLETYPDGATIRDSRGRLPLHVAAASEFQVGTNHRRSLIKEFGAATRIRDSKGYLPVHCAIAAQNFETATLLIEEHVGKIDNTFPGVPPLLHMALEYEAPDQFVELLLEKTPNCSKAISIGDDRRLPLHSALFYQASQRQVELILDAHPAALKQGDDDLWLPLHYEAYNCARLDVLTLFLARFPESSEKTTTSGTLAIHWAAQNRSATVESLQLLFQSHPTGLLAVDKIGDTVLHYAFSYSKNQDPHDFSEPVVAWLLENCPSLVQTVNKYGDFPLHCAAPDKSCPLHILRTLIEKFPQALEAHGYLRSLPLHVAVGRAGVEHVPKENIQLLLDKYPAASRIANSEGQLPLHIACACNAEIVDMLIDANPNGLSVYDSDGYLPFHSACVEGKSVSTVEHLITKLDGSLLPSTKDGTSALFLACEKDTSLDVILTLVQHSPEAFSGDMYTDHGNKKRASLSCSASLRSRCKRRKT